MRVATQETIARKLGISRSTVSVVLGGNQKIGISPKTQELVLKAARELNYNPNNAARALSTGHTGLIGFIGCTTWLETNLERNHFSELALHEAGYRLLVTNVSWHSGMETALKMMLESKVEGVIISGSNLNQGEPERYANLLMKSGVPIVMLGSSSKFAPVVIADVKQGMKDLTQQMINKGYKRLALLLPPDKTGQLNTPTISRLNGFMTAVQKHTNVYYKIFRVDNSISPYGSGEMGVKEIRSSGWKPDAILCCNDYWAMGAIFACQKLGLQIPKDIAITGFDGTHLGTFFNPPITTVVQPNEKVGRQASQLLIDLIRAKNKQPKKMIYRIPCSVEIRESSK
jgi:DNA-binding LacI/PurR family transcriptional regulator